MRWIKLAAKIGPIMSRRQDIETALSALAPRLGPKDRAAIVDRALGSRGLARAKPPTAAWLALVAYARHGFTDYDALLAEGYDADAARHFTLDETQAVLETWGCRHPIGAQAPA